MEIIKTTRKIKCSFAPGCENAAEYKIKINKYALGICQKCLQNLHIQVSRLVVPPAIVTKFRLKR